MILSINKYVIAAAISSFTMFAHANTAPSCNNKQVCKLGMAAEEAFFEGWATGDWDMFRDMLKKMT